jgi:hypothetical protein
LGRYGVEDRFVSIGHGQEKSQIFRYPGHLICPVQS